MAVKAIQPFTWPLTVQSAAEDGRWSAVQGVRGSSTKPYPPRGLRTSSATSKVTLTWDVPVKNATQIAQWRVYMDTEDNQIAVIRDPTVTTYDVQVNDSLIHNFFVVGVDALGKTSTFVRTTAAALPLDLDHVDDGTTFKRTPNTLQSEIVENSNFEAASTLVKGAPPGWQLGQYGISSNAVASYETAAPYGGLQSLKIVASSTAGGVTTIKKMSVTPGDTWKLVAAVRTLAGPGAGNVKLGFLDKTGALIGGGINVGNGGGAFVLGSQTGVVPAGAVWGVVMCYLSGGAGTAEYDAIQTFRGRSLDDEVNDGLSRKARTGAHSSYRALTRPLTATDAGANATVSIASHTMRVAGVDISNNSGSITGLSYGTHYYVYYDDPNFAGGAVTYHATTTKETALQGDGRFFVESIITPKAGQPDTKGLGDGGGGVQYGNIFFLSPGSAVNTGAGYTSPISAMDGDYTTASIGGSTGFVVAEEWFGFGGSSPKGPKSLTLYIDSEVLNTFDGIAKLEYSTNSGSTFTTLYTTVAGTPRSRQIDSVSLAINTSPGVLRVRATADDSGGLGGSLYHKLYEIWAESEF